MGVNPHRFILFEEGRLVMQDTGPRHLPPRFCGVRNFNELSAEEAAEYGWYVCLMEYPIRPEFQKYSDPIIDHEHKMVTYKTLEKTPEESEAWRKEEGEKKIKEVWEATKAYEEQWISGSAIGLVTALVSANNEKGLQCQAWINSVWDDYHVKKNIIRADWSFVPSLDCSNKGPMPVSIFELMEEYRSTFS